MREYAKAEWNEMNRKRAFNHNFVLLQHEMRTEISSFP